MADRRDFFRSLAQPLNRNQASNAWLVRPPYGVDESTFQSMCPTCESKACATYCDEKIIVIGEDGTPTLDFSKNGCTFCDECANVCDLGVLSLEHEATLERINAMFRINFEACVAHQGVICNACKEPCIDDAILFNGMFNPVIDEDRCTGCGFCIARCPTQAIDFRVLAL